MLLEHSRFTVDPLLPHLPTPLIFLEGPFSGTEEGVLGVELEALHGLLRAAGATSRFGYGAAFVRSGEAVFVGGPAVDVSGLGGPGGLGGRVSVVVRGRDLHGSDISGSVRIMTIMTAPSCN